MGAPPLTRVEVRPRRRASRRKCLSSARTRRAELGTVAATEHRPGSRTSPRRGCCSTWRGRTWESGSEVLVAQVRPRSSSTSSSSSSGPLSRRTREGGGWRRMDARPHSCASTRNYIAESDSSSASLSAGQILEVRQLRAAQQDPAPRQPDGGLSTTPLRASFPCLVPLRTSAAPAVAEKLRQSTSMRSPSGATTRRSASAARRPDRFLCSSSSTSPTADEKDRERVDHARSSSTSSGQLSRRELTAVGWHTSRTTSARSESDRLGRRGQQRLPVRRRQFVLDGLELLDVGMNLLAHLGVAVHSSPTVLRPRTGYASQRLSMVRVDRYLHLLSGLRRVSVRRGVERLQPPCPDCRSSQHQLPRRRQDLIAFW